MAAKGTIAKQAVIDKIAAALGEDFIGEYDKKIYVWSKENGEKIFCMCILCLAIKCCWGGVKILFLRMKIFTTGGTRPAFGRM